MGNIDIAEVLFHQNIPPNLVSRPGQPVAVYIFEQVMQTDR